MTPPSHAALSDPLLGSDPSLREAWEGIYVPEETKTLLRNGALLAVTLRGRNVDLTAVPIHGLQMLTGPPGTGKTTLAGGLASQLDLLLGDRLGPVTLIELDSHQLASDLLGQSQRSISQVLEEHVPALAADGAVA